MAGAQAVDWLNKACPKCGYVRTLADTNPYWQCPRCEIVYAKFIAAKAPAGARLAAHGREMADEASHDRSVHALVAANIIVLAIALFRDMTLQNVLLVYWVQSVVIGMSHTIRILSLQRFSTEGLDSPRTIKETPATKNLAAGFFVVHYGAVHALYLGILFDQRGDAGLLAGAGGAYALCALVFAVNHFFSLAHNLKTDAAAKPRLTTLMVLPYARVVPMHLMTLIGLLFTDGEGAFALLLFGALKTAADVVMHTLDHHLMRWKINFHNDPYDRIWWDWFFESDSDADCD